jgi:NAD(P)-dependent dehydrogenase (short-subunit alcohol dehydrogenase family)
MTASGRFDLGGRTALVTGGSRGLGLHMAQVLGEAGARLAITARRQDELDAARARLEGAGLQVHAVAHDLSQVQTVPAMVQSVIGQLGPIDILVNNAGATWGAPAEDYPREAWDKVMGLNVDGSWAVTQAVASQSMIGRRSGSIVFVSSIAGLAGNRPEFVQTVAYNTSKAALINLARSLAGEWGRYGIRVNCIAPGFIPSKMSDGALSRMRERYLERVPLGRLGRDEDLSGALLFLAGDASAYVSGQVLAVDGGLSAVW